VVMVAAQTRMITLQATLETHQEATEEAPPRNHQEVMVAIQTQMTTLQATQATHREVMVAAQMIILQATLEIHQEATEEEAPPRNQEVMVAIQTQTTTLQATQATRQEDMAEAVILMDQATPGTHQEVMEEALTTQTPMAALVTKVTAPLASCSRRPVTCSRTTTWFRRDRPSALRQETMITPVETLAVAITGAETIMITTRWITSGNDCTMRWNFFRYAVNLRYHNATH
jgi:hypothetical protein